MAKTPKTTKAPKGNANPSLKMIEFTAANVNDAIAATGAKKSSGLLRVPVDAITEIAGFNLRVETPAYFAGIEDLKQSILLEGFYDSKPLSCFAAIIDGNDAIVLIDGHRRFAAVKAAIADGSEIETVPVVLKKATSSDLDLAVSLHKENASEPLTMLERAVLAQRMLRSGNSESEVAERLQVTPRHVGDLKVLITAPKGVRDLVRDGLLSATEAVTQLRKDSTGEKLLAAAEKRSERAAERSDKSGAAKEARLTRQTVESGGEQRPKMQVHRANFSATAGGEFLYADAFPFLGVIGDETWFKNARSKLKRIALEDISVEVKIRRPKSAEETDAEAEAAAEKPAKTNGKRIPETALDPDFDDAPDLGSLGIAERADESAGL